MSSKSDVMIWESVASFVCTFPSDDGCGACDVAVQIGSVDQYVVTQMGDDSAHATRGEAEEEADRLNAEAEEEAGEEIIGDGAASVSECSVWFIRTRDDAGGSDDADDTAYETREAAEAAAEALALERDEGDGGESAEDYLRAADKAAAGEPDADGEWCVYWETALDDAGPRSRYATQEQAEAAARVANDDLRAHNPGGNLLCGFSVRKSAAS